MSTLGSEYVSTLMSTQLISLSPDSTLREARDILAKYSIRHITVLNDGKLVGLLSKNDVDKFSFSSKSDFNEIQSKLAENLTVEHLMIKSIHTLQQDDTIKEAAELLSLSSYHALPVMKGEELVGIVTTTDLILYLLKHCN